ncbi:hypothetical protein RQN30_08595 [Arcanobacterium hippocoleae]
MSLRTYTCNNSTLVIDTLGGRVHSFQTAAAGEFLFQSGDGTAHSGIPLCAPWFGKGQIGAVHPRTHGLVKHVEWEVAAETVTENEIKLELALSAEAVRDLPGFAGYEGLSYRLFVNAADTLQLTLQFCADRRVSVDTAFHTYFAAPLPADVHLAVSTHRDYVAGTEGRFSGVFQ